MVPLAGSVVKFHLDAGKMRVVCGKPTIAFRHLVPSEWCCVACVP